MGLFALRGGHPEPPAAASREERAQRVVPMGPYAVLALLLGAPLALSQERDCKRECKKMVGELAAFGECRDWRERLPRPKIGRACTDAFSSIGTEACTFVCNGDELPVQTKTIGSYCRKYDNELPKPWMHKSCKHGGNRGWELGLEAARDKYPAGPATPDDPYGDVPGSEDQQAEFR